MVGGSHILVFPVTFFFFFLPYELYEGISKF